MPGWRCTSSQHGGVLFQNKSETNQKADSHLFSKTESRLDQVRARAPAFRLSSSPLGAGKTTVRWSEQCWLMRHSVRAQLPRRLVLGAASLWPFPWNVCAKSQVFFRKKPLKRENVEETSQGRRRASKAKGLEGQITTILRNREGPSSAANISFHKVLAFMATGKAQVFCPAGTALKSFPVAQTV